MNEKLDATSDSRLGAEPPSEAPLRLVIVYKFVRAALALALSMTLGIAALSGWTTNLRAVIEHVQHHAVSAWSIALADQVVRTVTPRHVGIAAGALLFDSAFTFLEGYALHRRFVWAPWLVVVATAAFVPLEVVALVRRFGLSRALLLFFNILIAAYLAQRALREHALTARR